MVVRLTAVTDLQICIDDFDFHADLFQPFLSQTLDAFMVLLTDVDEISSKLKIVNCMIIIIERMESFVIFHSC